MCRDGKLYGGVPIWSSFPATCIGLIVVKGQGTWQASFDMD